MRALLVLWIGLCFGLSGCLLPTPVSILTSGLDAVSFVASGKTVADHGVSLAMGEDCAMLWVLEGDLCREEHDYALAAAPELLAPLPLGSDGVLLAQVDPEIRAASERLAAYQGWADEPANAGSEPRQLQEQPQFAMLTGGFVADDVSPVGYRLADPVETAPLALAALPDGPSLATAEANSETAGNPVIPAEVQVLPRRRPAVEPVLLAQATLLGDGWAERPEPALQRALLPVEAPEAVAVAAVEWRKPRFATASDEFGKRPVVVRYGRISDRPASPERRIAGAGWGGTEHEG